MNAQPLEMYISFAIPKLLFHTRELMPYQGAKCNNHNALTFLPVSNSWDSRASQRVCSIIQDRFVYGNCNKRLVSSVQIITILSTSLSKEEKRNDYACYATSNEKHLVCTPPTYVRNRTSI